MASHNVSPVRTQIRHEIVEALADGQPRTAEQLYDLCPSATDPSEVSKVTYEMRRVGLIALGDKGKNASNMGVNTYLLASTNPYLAAAKPIQVEPKIKKNRQPAIKRKPAPGHPFAAPISPKAPQDRVPRVTRDLPMHLRSTAPQMAAEGIKHHILETIMSEDPLQYIPDPDGFSNELDEAIDADLVDALRDLAHQEVIDADSPDELLAKMVPLPMAEMGELPDALGKVGTQSELTATEAISMNHERETKRVCKCVRMNRLPPLPVGYRYSGLSVEMVAEGGCEIFTLKITDEGGGPLVELDTIGKMRFNRVDLATISRAADAFIALFEDE